MDSLRAHLLVASPSMLDPNFHRTVVLVAEHSDEGAMGVVLNRPMAATVGEAVPDLTRLIEPDEPVFAGGPVADTGVVVLAEFDDPAVAAAPVDARLGFLALDSEVQDVAPHVMRARAFAGHAGWGPGQLDGEIDQDAWIVAPFVAEDAFSADPDRLWSAALRRLGGAYELVARMPLDPSLN